MSQKRTVCVTILLALSLVLNGSGLADGADVIWSTFLGGSGTEECYGIGVDSSGNAYLTGWTRSRDFPTTAGVFDSTPSDSSDVFVAKLHPTGSHLIYATFLGGNDWDQAFGIAVDDAGNAYVTGNTMSRDFPVTSGVVDTTHNGNWDAFVAKLNPEGNILVFATFLGGSRYDRGKSIVTDSAGNAYLTGWTRSEDFPTTKGAFSIIFLGHQEEDAFVAKLNPTGSQLVYSTFLGGTQEDWGRGIAVDKAGNAYVAVLTYSEDIPVTSGAFDETYNGSREAFVAKLNPRGSSLDYATFLGGRGQDWCQDIVVDASGNACLTGVTLSANFPTTTGAWDTAHNGFSDAYVAVLNPAGSHLVYATFLGGTGEERSTGLVVDGAGHVVVTGWTRSEDFPTTRGAFDTEYNGQTDAFVAQLDPKEGTLRYASFLGGSSFDAGFDIALDGAGSILLTGWTRSEDFPTTEGALDTEHNGGEDGFLTKLELPGRR
jgi:hypothetical protein